MKTLSIVTPVFNEEEVIETFYRELRAVLDSIADRYDATILFVVDRSTDRTLDILREIATSDRSVQVLALSSRFGHQMSLLAGIDHAYGDAVITMDSDLEHPPSLIPVMLEQFEHGYDVVQTARVERAGTPLLDRLSSRFFYRLINRVSNVPIAAAGADFRLISARVATVFRDEIRERNQFLRGLIAWAGFRSCQVAYAAGAREGGRPKYSFAKKLRLAIDGIVSFSKRPLQAAVYVGVLLATVSFALGVFSVVSYFTSARTPAGWATLSVLITFFSGIQLIFLGVIGEYIGTIFDEVKRRPHYLVDEAINFAPLERVAPRESLVAGTARSPLGR